MVDDMENTPIDPQDAPCIGDCIDCPYFLRFDICAPEYSTYFHDIYYDKLLRDL